MRSERAAAGWQEELGQLRICRLEARARGSLMYDSNDRGGYHTTWGISKLPLVVGYHTTWGISKLPLVVDYHTTWGISKLPLVVDCRQPHEMGVSDYVLISVCRRCLIGVRRGAKGATRTEGVRLTIRACNTRT